MMVYDDNYVLAEQACSMSSSRRKTYTDSALRSGINSGSRIKVSFLCIRIFCAGLARLVCTTRQLFSVCMNLPGLGDLAGVTESD